VLPSFSTEAAAPAAGRAGSSRLAGLAVNLALAAASLTVAFGGAEFLCRTLEPKPPPAAADYITDWQNWDGEFYTVKSTAVGWPPWEDYNSEGLRDHEHTLVKRPGSWRVACLGDSVTLGWGIQPYEAWPQTLEDLAAATGRDFDVMNVALGGWATRQELIAYRRIARRYHPDQVLLGICLNDVPEMQNNLSRPPRLLAELHHRSALVRRLIGARRREITSVEQLFSAPEAENVREGYRRMFADLRALRDEVRADGGRFAVLVFPFRFQVEPGAPPPLAQRTIGEFCRQEGIGCLDLLPALRGLGPAAFHDYDHFSPAGARAVAQYLVDSRLMLAQQGVEPGDAAAAPGPPTPPVRDPAPLLRALRDPSSSEQGRIAAARALGTLGEAGAKAVPALVAALEDHGHSVRVAAAWALGDVGPPAGTAIPALVTALGDRDPLLRAGAAHAMGEIGGPARLGLHALIAHLSDQDERVRWNAADAVGKIGPGPESLDALRVILADVDGPGRGLAAQSLGRVGPEARVAVPELIEVAFDPRLDVRWRAVWALGRIGPAAASAVPALRRALADPELRWRAAEALGGIGSGAREAVPDLVGLLQDPSSSVRWRAAGALGAIGVPSAAPSLARLVRDPAENVRLAAVEGLLRVSAEATVARPAFLTAAHDDDSRVRQHAVRGLRRLRSPSPDVRAAIAAARRDPDERVRVEAARAPTAGEGEMP